MAEEQKPCFTAHSKKLSVVHESLVSAFETGDPQVHVKEPERTHVTTVQSMYGELGKGDINGSYVLLQRRRRHRPAHSGFVLRRYAEGKSEARDLNRQNFDGSAGAANYRW